MVAPRGTREVAIYVLVSAAMIGLGVFLRSALLNWIAGPAFVVVSVAILQRIVPRRRGDPP